METLEFRQVLKTAWWWRWGILAAMALSLATGFLVTRSMTAIYKSTTTLMVGQFLDRERPTAQDMMAGERLAETYAHLVAREVVLQATVTELGLPTGWRDLAIRVSAAPRARTQLLDITVSDSDPEQARRIADEIASQLIRQSPTGGSIDDEDHSLFLSDQLARLRTQIGSLQDQLGPLEEGRTKAPTAQQIRKLDDGIASLKVKLSGLRQEYVALFKLQGDREQTNYLSVVESAFTPTRPSSPKLWLNLALSGLGGALLTLLGVFLFDLLDDRYRSAEEVEEDLELPLMATISTIPRQSSEAGGSFLEAGSDGRAGEEFNLLRANLAFTRFTERSNMILLTSAGPSEGKTVSVSNLGMAIARSGKHVLLVDADLRRFGLTTALGFASSPGLSTLLVDASLKVADVIVPTAIDRLSLLPSGPAPPNPVELLESELMRERVGQLQELADTILIDSPPVLALADAPLLASLSKNVLLIVDSGSTQRRSAKSSKEALAKADAHFLGIILNRHETGLSSHYYDYSSTADSA